MTQIPGAFRTWNESRRISLDDEEVRRLFDEGSTAVEMAKHFGCSTQPVKTSMRRLGLRRPAKRRPGVGSGAGNSAWKGGRRVRRDGYVMVWTPAGERLEHRVLMERHIGRPLTNSEIVHHKNEDPGDNCIDNLEIMTQSKHARLHAAARTDR